MCVVIHPLSFRRIRFASFLSLAIVANAIHLQTLTESVDVKIDLCLFSTIYLLIAFHQSIYLLILCMKHFIPFSWFDGNLCNKMKSKYQCSWKEYIVFCHFQKCVRYSWHACMSMYFSYITFSDLRAKNHLKITK